MLEKVEGNGEGVGQRVEMVRRHHRSMDMSLRLTLEIVEDRGAWHATVHGVAGPDAT